jgi:hypothetical protein
MSIALSALFCFAMAGEIDAQTLSGPESLEYDASGQRYLISNRSAGQILARSSSGTLSVFTDDPVAPAGMEIVGANVFVADQGRIRGYRLSDGVNVLNYLISGATFLNGMGSDPDNLKLWVGDFSQRRLFEVDISNLANVSHTTLVSDTVFTPNGVLFDRANARLLVVTWGGNAMILQYPFAGGGLTTLVSTSLGNFDGIVADCSGRIYVSAWSSQSVHIFNPPLSAASTPSLLVSGLSNPADISYNTVSGEIAVPNAGNSTVSFHPTACSFLFRSGFEVVP